MEPAFGRPSGSRALDFINTLDWRDDPAKRVDLIATARDLSAWASHVGFAAADARAVRETRHVAGARRLREELAALFRAVAEDQPLPPATLAALTMRTRAAWRDRELAGTRSGADWQWRSASDPAARVLHAIALDAGELLLSPHRDRVRLCAGEGCGWLFLDASKAGRRRWCSMAACGNRAKVRDYRERVARG